MSLLRPPCGVRFTQAGETDIIFTHFHGLNIIIIWHIIRQNRVLFCNTQKPGDEFNYIFCCVLHWHFVICLIIATKLLLHFQALVLLTIVENIAEFAPKYTQIIFRRNEVLTLTLCIFGFLLGLPHVTQVIFLSIIHFQ